MVKRSRKGAIGSLSILLRLAWREHHLVDLCCKIHGFLAVNTRRREERLSPST
jgi:hypothetical protein